MDHLKNALESKSSEQQTKIVDLTAENARLSSKVEFLMDKHSFNENKIHRSEKELNILQQYVSQILGVLEKTQKKYSEISAVIPK